MEFDKDIVNQARNKDPEAFRSWMFQILVNQCKRKLQNPDAWSNNYEEGLSLNAQIRDAYIGKYFYTINQGFTIRCFDMETDFALKSEYEY